MSLRDELLEEIGAFCQRAEIAETTFGFRAVNDGKFVGRLKEGGSLTVETVEKVRSYIANTPIKPRPTGGEPLQGAV